MFSFLFGKKTARKWTSSSRPSGFRPQCEVLEDRLVMTSLANMAGPVAQIANPFSSLPPAQAVNLMAEPRDLVGGILTGAKTSQLFSFQLQQGDFLQADVSVGPSSPGDHATCQMSLLNSSGTVFDTTSSNTPYGFRAPASGTYYAEITGVVSGLIPLGSYELELHRLALAQGMQSVATLAQTGSMYAWLNGNTLDISGPTGNGFGITGNWTQTTITINGLVSSTYTATGTLELQTAAGPMTLGIASGQIGTVTTAAQINGKVFGVISNLNIPVTMNTGPMVANVASVFGFDLNPLDENVTFDLNIGGTAGIGLGNSAVLQATSAPLNNAVPYLYFTINPLGSSLTNVLSVVYDPADPALYVEAGVVGLPLGPLTVNGVGFSQHGLIPYKPVDAPSQYTGSMAGGHLFLQGSVNTTAITEIPSKVVGSITLNFDPNGTGKFLGGTGVSVADLVDVFTDGNTAPLAQNLGQVFQNLSVGINGTLEINPLEGFLQDGSWWVGNQILALPTGPSSVLDQTLNYINNGIGNPNSLAGNPQNFTLLPIGHASLIYDGPTQSLYFRGGTTNPFAGTPLASLTPLYTFLTQTGTLPTLDLDGAVKPGGEIFLNVTSTGNIAGLPESSQVLLARDYPVTGPAVQYLLSPNATAVSPLTVAPKGQRVSSPALYTGIYIDANVNVLGSYVDLQGRMDGNGYFTLKANAQVNLGPLSGSASFTLSDTQAQGFSFTADLNASFSTSYIRGNVGVSFTFGIANGSITYAGSVEASGQVNALFGWVGGSLAGGISNGEIWISADGYQVDFQL
jgi:hypothetical protein